VRNTGLETGATRESNRRADAAPFPRTPAASGS
jgi:hypothetical protein